MIQFDELRKVLVKNIMPGIHLLPDKMDSPRARAQLLAIGLQESRFQNRRQIGGPARGFWQFEESGGVKGVLSHPSSAPYALTSLKLLGYAENAHEVYVNLEHDDKLAAIFARLLLWTDPKPLARLDANSPEASEEAWQYYVRNWRPGKPHRETWDVFWSVSCKVALS